MPGGLEGLVNQAKAGGPTGATAVADKNEKDKKHQSKMRNKPETEEACVHGKKNGEKLSAARDVRACTRVRSTLRS